jgi:N6-L-threonylcarbamoyladenine synthase/protein kinase Bud32
VEGPMLKHALTPEHVRTAGSTVGLLHAAGIIHGDLTTSNIILRDGVCVLIDFGLAFVSAELEDRGVDIHVFFQTLESTSTDYATLRDAFIDGYGLTNSAVDDVVGRVDEIKRRGRYL